MAAKPQLNVKILSEKRKVFEGTCDALLVPDRKDTVAIMPYHTPLIMMLGVGEISIITRDGRQSIQTVRSGIVYVAENTASVLVNI